MMRKVLVLMSIETLAGLGNNAAATSFHCAQTKADYRLCGQVLHA